MEFVTYLLTRNFNDADIKAVTEADLLDVETLNHTCTTTDMLAQELDWKFGKCARLKAAAQAFLTPTIATPVSAATPSIDTSMVQALAQIVNPTQISEMKLLDVLNLAANAPAPDDQMAIVSRLSVLASEQLGRNGNQPCIAFKDGKLDVSETIALWTSVRGAGDVSWPAAFHGCILKHPTEIFNLGKVYFSPTTGKQLIDGRDGSTNWGVITTDMSKRMAFVVYAKEQGELRNWRDADIVDAVKGTSVLDGLDNLYKAFEHKCSEDFGFQAKYESQVCRKPLPPQREVTKDTSSNPYWR